MHPYFKTVKGIVQKQPCKDSAYLFRKRENSENVLRFVSMH